jgi:hypothetical protein
MALGLQCAEVACMIRRALLLQNLPIPKRSEHPDNQSNKSRARCLATIGRDLSADGALTDACRFGRVAWMRIRLDQLATQKVAGRAIV